MFERLHNWCMDNKYSTVVLCVGIITLIVTTIIGYIQIDIGYKAIDLASKPSTSPSTDSATSTYKNTSTQISPDTVADPVTACNNLASDPDDYFDIGPNGVPTITDKNAALQSCQAAVNAHPSNARLHHQLGRAYEAIGDIGHAIEQYQYSAENGYRPAAAKHGEQLWKDHKYDRGAHFFELSVGGSARGEYDLGLLKITGYTIGSHEVVRRDCYGGYKLIKHAADKKNKSAEDDPIISSPPNC